VRDLEAYGVIDVEVDADVGVYWLAGPRSVAGPLLQRAGAAELLDPVGAVFVEDIFQHVEQAPVSHVLGVQAA
jgi:hypothetical protein